MSTPQDVQAKLDIGIGCLNKTTTSGVSWIKTYGADWTKWPQTSNWYQAYKNIYDARAEAGQLVTKALTSDFTSQVS